jgi:hypothetical protein
MTSNEFYLFAIFGGVMAAAGLFALLTGEMRLGTRTEHTWRALPPLTGSRAYIGGMCYLLWGAFLGLIALQLYQNQHPTMLESIQSALKWNKQSAMTAVIVLTGLVLILPGFFFMFEPRNRDDN